MVSTGSTGACASIVSITELMSVIGFAPDRVVDSRWSVVGPTGNLSFVILQRQRRPQQAGLRMRDKRNANALQPGGEASLVQKTLDESAGAQEAGEPGSHAAGDRDGARPVNQRAVAGEAAQNGAKAGQGAAGQHVVAGQRQPHDVCRAQKRSSRCFTLGRRSAAQRGVDARKAIPG